MIFIDDCIIRRYNVLRILKIKKLNLELLKITALK
jgi:hypothetical protein